jgi:hypothetical protein
MNPEVDFQSPTLCWTRRVRDWSGIIGTWPRQRHLEEGEGKLYTGIRLLNLDFAILRSLVKCPRATPGFFLLSR